MRCASESSTMLMITNCNVIAIECSLLALKCTVSVWQGDLEGYDA